MQSSRRRLQVCRRCRDIRADVGAGRAVVLGGKAAVGDVVRRAAGRRPRGRDGPPGAARLRGAAAGPDTQHRRQHAGRQRHLALLARTTARRRR